MQIKKTEEFKPGQYVYVRWQGEEAFTVVREHEVLVNGVRSPIRHYVCRAAMHMGGEHYIFSMLHLSTKPLEPLVRSHNKRQLISFR